MTNSKRKYEACIICGFTYGALLTSPYCGKHQGASLQKLGFDEHDRTRTIQLTMGDDRWHDVLDALYRSRGEIESNYDTARIVRDALGADFNL